MSIRTRKLIGTILLLLFVGFYSILVMALGSSHLMDVNGFVTLLFYAGAGLLWVPPAAIIVRWMQRPERETLAGSS